MGTSSIAERIRVGTAELRVVVAGSTLLPTADTTACCCCCCCSAARTPK